jgi:hypothetical protein
MLKGLAPWGQQYLRMTGMTRFAARLPSLGGWLPSLTLGRRRIGGRWSTRVSRVLVQACFKSFQALEECEYHQTHTHRGLVPLFRWYTQSLWQRCGIKHIAHERYCTRLPGGRN